MKARRSHTSWAEALTRWYHQLSVVASAASLHERLGAIVVRSPDSPPDNVRELEVEYLSRRSLAEFLYDSIVGTAGNDVELAVLFTAGVLDQIDCSEATESLCFLVTTDSRCRPVQMFRVQRREFGPAAISGYRMILN